MRLHIVIFSFVVVEEAGLMNGLVPPWHDRPGKHFGVGTYNGGR